MALVVEDGTGVTGAESYESVANITAYWNKRPHDRWAAIWLAAAAAVPTQEGAARSASIYCDVIWGESYLGDARKVITQGLLWPRVWNERPHGAQDPMYPWRGISRPPSVGPYGANDPLEWNPTIGAVEGDVAADLTVIKDASGFTLAAVPAPLKVAVAELAPRALALPLVADNRTGGRIKVERAGNHSNEYFDDKDAAPAYGVVLEIIRPILKATGGSWHFS